MKIIFDKFYRERGIRNYGILASVRVWPIRVLPLNSIVHFLSEDEQLFPDPSSHYLKETTRRVLLVNYTELKEGNHSQNKIVKPVNNLILEYIKNNPKFQNFIKPISEAKDQDQLVFCNYNLSKLLYKYSESNKFVSYYKWLDKNKLLWSQVNEICKTSSRNHFYDFEVPVDLPSKARLNAHSQNVNADMLKYFNNSQSLFLLDLWRWLNPETREQSCLGQVETMNLPKCNILFHIRDGRSAVLNLGYLNSWIEGQPNQTDRPNAKGIQVTQLQILLLKFLMDLQAMSVELLSSERESEAQQEADRQKSEEGRRRDPFGDRGETDAELDRKENNSERDFQQDDLTDDFSKTSQSVDGSKIISSVSNAATKTSQEPEIKDDEEELSFEDTLKKAEEEVKTLEELEERRTSIQEVKEEDSELYNPESPLDEKTLEETIFKPRDPTQRLMERLDQAATKGAITAADYRKITKELEEQGNKPDPLGSKRTLKEMTKITSEDITFDEEKATLAGDERILDDSMKRSVIESLDKDYIRKTFSKDIVASIMGIQSAGVLVKEVEHETHHSVLGSFESFSLQLKPIDGRSSVLRIKFPTVEEDGTFKSNGVRYHMRKQRVDLPIRKINATKVSLSSYYGKLFVFRSPKKADSSLTPVINKIVAGSIGEVENITEVRSANVFNNKIKAPMIYSALSGYYKSFKIKHPIFGELSFDFDYRKRFESLQQDEKNSLKVEIQGKILVGKTHKGHPIVVDPDNNFTAILPNGEQPLGNIFDLLDIDRTTVPVDAAVMKVRGCTLPIGLVLGRTMGLKNLLKFSKAKYRLVKGRQQKQLKPNEYAISFSNYSLILDRDDQKATMIFGGFDIAHKFIKKLPIEAFEKKEAYEDVIDSMGGNVTIYRELDLLESSFVDPITQNILQEMKEPETFLGLLDRSCELLVSYSHPDSQDLDYQQIRGYERFAGTIYRELIRSIRAFKNKNISGKGKVEMSPFAVHQALMEDRSVKTCEDINPIQNLKMHEAVTFAGEGGREKDTFLGDARAMTEKDVGVISEASVDSGDVGYNIFMSGNPTLKNLRGMRSEGEPESKSGHYYSSSMLLAVGSAHDD